MTQNIIWRSKKYPWLADIHVEDYPYVDPTTEDGQETLGGLAAMAHLNYPEIIHVRFLRDMKQIGEMLFPPKVMQ